MPAVVQAGSGVAVTTGTGTPSLAGATVGNLVLLHMVVRGTSEDWSTGTVTAIESLNATPTSIDTIVSGQQVGDPISSTHTLWVGRATGASPSMEVVVGASGEDLFARMYEFSGEAAGTTIATVVENDASTFGATVGTSATVGDADVVTNGASRLACNFVALASNQAIGPFTGETGGDWAEVAEYQDATGTTATLQLQTADMPSAGTISGGTVGISSVAWGVIGVAIIPAPSGATVAWIVA